MPSRQFYSEEQQEATRGEMEPSNRPYHHAPQRYAKSDKDYKTLRKEYKEQKVAEEDEKF